MSTIIVVLKTKEGADDLYRQILSAIELEPEPTKIKTDHYGEGQGRVMLEFNNQNGSSEYQRQKELMSIWNSQLKTLIPQGQDPELSICP